MPEPTYDVFLSHSSSDKPAVEALARRLKAEGLEPFLDKWHLVPGEPWQEALEEALKKSRVCAVFLGPGGVGTWHNEEMRAALDRRTRRNGFRVVPVLLPGSKMPEDEDLPAFLARVTWVDFRSEILGVEDQDTFHRLVCGIRGVAPGSDSEGSDNGGKEEADITRETRTEKILIVDDNPTNILIFTQQLDRLGFEKLYIAHDGLEGLEIAKKETPNLVLADIDMPVMDGFEMLSKMAALKLPTRVVMATAFYPDARSVVRAMKLGACDYLVKPYREAELERVIRRALALESTLALSTNEFVNAGVLKDLETLRIENIQLRLKLEGTALARVEREKLQLTRELGQARRKLDRKISVARGLNLIIALGTSLLLQRLDILSSMTSLLICSVAVFLLRPVTWLKKDMASGARKE